MARLAQEQGAEVVLTSFGRQFRLTEAIARRLPLEAPVVELDVTSAEDLEALAGRVREHTDHLDGVVHSIGFAPQSVMGGNFLAGPVGGRRDRHPGLGLLAQVARGGRAAAARAGLLDRRAHLRRALRLARLRLDGRRQGGVRVDARYLARDLGPSGIRVNLVAAGPIRTTAAKSIPGVSKLEEGWPERAPLGWDVHDPEPAARAVAALLSDWFPATTGEIVHVDGGVHAMGA